jgi:hypothetical protein
VKRIKLPSKGELPMFFSKKSGFGQILQHKVLHNFLRSLKRYCP